MEKGSQKKKEEIAFKLMILNLKIEELQIELDFAKSDLKLSRLTNKIIFAVLIASEVFHIFYNIYFIK